MPDQLTPGATAWIGFFLPPEVAQPLALAGGEPASELHLTLAFLGDADKLDLDRLKEGLALWGKNQIPISGRISGVGRFNETGEEGQHAFYASVDAPGLARFRQNLVNELDWLDCPADRTHGYTPHITLQYLPAGDPSPLTSLERIFEVELDTMTLVISEPPVADSDRRELRRIEYQLTGGPVEKTQAAGFGVSAQSNGQWTRFAKIDSLDAEERMIYGVAATEEPDDQAGVWEGRKYEGDIVTIEAIEEALPDYLKWANIREMHQPSAVGTTLETEIKDRKLHIGVRIVDGPAWEKVKEKVYRGFSVGGQVLKAKLVEIGGKIYRKILKLKLYEISLVDRPANGGSEILLFKLSTEETMATDNKDKKPAAANSDGGAGDKAAQALTMLQELRDECERSGDMAGAGKYGRAIALMIGEAEGSIAAGEGVEDDEVQLSQKSGDLQKAIKPALDGLAKAIQDGLAEQFKTLDERLANIEAQPAAGGPSLRQAEKPAPGQQKPARQDPAFTKGQLGDLKQKASTEPNPALRAQYQQQYIHILESAVAA
jgi:2'-5' RNA ligase